MEQTESITELATALAAAQGEFSAIPKTESNPFFKSKYADLATVVATAGPVLAKHGLSVTQLIGWEDNADVLTTQLNHASGQWIRSTARLFLNKADSQSQGSSVTYMRRYSYMAICGLVADEDDDGNRASQTPAARAASPGGQKRKAKADTVDLSKTVSEYVNTIPGYGDALKAKWDKGWGPAKAVLKQHEGDAIEAIEHVRAEVEATNAFEGDFEDRFGQMVEDFAGEEG